MMIVLQNVLAGRHIASHGYSLDQKIAALLFSVVLILAGQNICCSFFVKNREKEVRVLELILCWQVSTACYLLKVVGFFGALRFRTILLLLQYI